MSDIRNLEIDLDIKQKLLVTVNCKQLDNLSLKFNIWDNGLSADLSNYKCRLKALKSGQIPLIQNTDIDVSGNEVTVEADEQLTTTSGIVKTELQFIDKITGKKKTSFDLNIKVISSTLESDRTISKATITLLEKLDNKLDQIEDIGNILDEAKTIKTGLETDITTANTSKNSLNTTITNADNKEKELETTIINAESKKEEVETSIGNANASKNNLNITITNADNKKTELETTITNAEDKKQEVILECKVADSKIKAMQEFGDVTEVAKDINKLKLDVGDTTELPTIDKSNVVNSIKEVVTDLNDLANLGFKENTSLSEETDINNIVQTGFCSINISMLNYPTMFINSNSCLLQTIASIDNLYPRQLAYDIFNPNIIVTRQCINGTWSGWKQIATTEKTTFPTLLNGWSQALPCAISKNGTIVTICGLLNTGVMTTNTVIFIVPEGYRPSIERRFALFQQSQSYGGTSINIKNNGEVRLDDVTNLVTGTYTFINFSYEI